MAVTLSKDKVERLVFAKYLLSRAKQEKDAGRPLSSFAVLILHDLVEIFLQVAIETLNPSFKKPQTKILETLTDGVNGVLLSSKLQTINDQFIKRLNGLRNLLKHQTIFVDEIEIQNLFTETNTFLIDFTPLIFNIDINEVTLVSLIQNEKVRENLQAAEREITLGNLTEAMLSITKSFHYFEYNQKSLKDENGEGILYENKVHSYTRQFSVRRMSLGGKDFGNDVKWLAGEIEKDMIMVNQKLQLVEKTIAYGINYKKYVKFTSIIPHIYLPSTADKPGNLHFIVTEAVQRKEYTLDQVRFCFDLVTELALVT